MRNLLRLLVLTWSLVAGYASFGATTVRLSITETGAKADTVNTVAIQSAIDKLASSGGGTVVIPAGVFVSGALDLKPGVNLHLDQGAVLRAISTDVAVHFPARPTRIEGRSQLFTPALINADGCDGLRITGEGTLDGNGRPVWDEFWTRLKADKKTRNLDVPRARLAFIANSRDVRIEGVTFKDSQFWNLHIYRCRDVIVRNARFTVPDNYKQAPSTDGIDVDSSQDVLIEGCHFSVTDDCIAMKGSKGPFALDDKDSPPVERVRILNCTFKRGHAALTLGSEATVVRDIVISDSVVTGSMSLLHFKLRPDTPQRYENIHYRDITLDSNGGEIVSVLPWKQYFDLQGQPPPKSYVRDVTLSGIKGRFGAFGVITGNPGQTKISGITLSDFDVSLKKPDLDARAAKDLRFDNVKVNGAAR